MPMNYNPQGYERSEGGGGKEGRYRFKIDNAEEGTYGKNKTPGANVTFLVDAGGTRDITCFKTFWYTDKSRWVLDQFLTALGFDFMKPPEVYELVNRFGEADFKKNDKGYLEPVKFYPVEGAGAGATRDDEPPPNLSEAPF